MTSEMEKERKNKKKKKGGKGAGAGSAEAPVKPAVAEAQTALPPPTNSEAHPTEAAAQQPSKAERKAAKKAAKKRAAEGEQLGAEAGASERDASNKVETEAPPRKKPKTTVDDAQLEDSVAPSKGEASTEQHGSKKTKESKRAKAAEEAENPAPAARDDGDDDDGEAAKAAKRKAKLKRKQEKRRAKELVKESQPPAGSNSEPNGSATPPASKPSSSATATLGDRASTAASARAYLASNNITIHAPEDSADARPPPLPMLAFDELRGRVDERIRSVLLAQGFSKPTPIQACCWSTLFEGRDVVGIAETGSGKTFAFGLPGVQHILTSPLAKVAGGDGASTKKAGKKRSNGSQSNGAPSGGDDANSPWVSVLVIAPTRELALQTHEHMAKLASAIGVGCVCLYGGVSKTEQLKLLRRWQGGSGGRVRIVVGTPGRILDLAREGSLDLSRVSYFVLDEADRMLDVGFEPDIRAIASMVQPLEAGRHTSMFSATWPPAVRGLAESFMRDPVRVTVGSDELSANHRVEQTVEVLQDGYEKERRLEQFLRQIGAGPRGKNSKDKVLIFALYKKEAQRVEDTLRRHGYKVAGIHGDLNQHQRMASLASFKSAETPLLVATDVAARGIDVPSVEYVINYTFPLTIEDYVHRIGRTGRGGKTGKSLTFFTQEDKAHSGELVRLLKDSNQEVPEKLLAFPQTIKKKEHSVYGAHFRELVPGKAKKITFD